MFVQKTDIYVPGTRHINYHYVYCVRRPAPVHTPGMLAMTLWSTMG